MAVISKLKDHGDPVIPFFRNRKAVIAFTAVCVITYIYFVALSSNEGPKVDSVKSKEIVVKRISTPIPAPEVVPVAIGPAWNEKEDSASTAAYVASPALASTISKLREQSLQMDADGSTNLDASTPKHTQPIPTGITISRTSTLKNLVNNYKIARKNMIESIKADYGLDNYHNIFEQEVDGVSMNRGRLLFVSKENASWERLKNRVMMKIIDVLLSKASDVRFVWATGGHSSTAGHGNFFDESYTAVLERRIKDVFGAVGIQFVGRNYALGMDYSGPETAWCLEEIFGAHDLDIVVWDYAQTDGKDTNKLVHYCYRAGLSPNKPACLAYHIGSNYMGTDRQKALIELEERGLVALFSNEEVLEAAQSGIPDSLGKTDDEINQMPFSVQNYKCGNAIETGDPYCRAQKFNLTMCEKRRYMTSWHPGWKWHALQGNLAAFFLMEILGDALRALKETTEPLPELHQRLKDDIDKSHEQLKISPLPSSTENYLDNRGDINLDDIYKTPNFCHTARIPADIRHKGILTGSLSEQGISEQEAATTPSGSEFMRLVRDHRTRQDCEAQLNIDHRDYFLVTDNDGWQKLVLPNDAEISEYGRGQQLRGLIAFCFKVCEHFNCPPGTLKASDIASGAAEIEVNGQPVVGLTDIHLCHFLRGEQGHYWPPSAESRFEIRARVTQSQSSLRFGSFVVW